MNEDNVYGWTCHEWWWQWCMTTKVWWCGIKHTLPQYKVLMHTYDSTWDESNNDDDDDDIEDWVHHEWWWCRRLNMSWMMMTMMEP